ncbi:hypothetical protein JW949_02105 [Candidatus Woesearchaeota archaeon]|nr:hypothetical protein [Candidatus Woesearchaeota archaeon]
MLGLAKINEKITDGYHSGLLKLNGVKEGLTDKIRNYYIHFVESPLGGKLKTPIPEDKIIETKKFDDKESYDKFLKENDLIIKEKITKNNREVYVGVSNLNAICNFNKGVPEGYIPDEKNFMLKHNPLSKSQ